MPNATHVLAGAAAALCTGSLAVAIHAQDSADEARAQAAAWRAQALQQAGDATAGADATPSPAQSQSGSGAQPVLPSTQQDSQAPQAVPQTPRTRES